MSRAMIRAWALLLATLPSVGWATPAVVAIFDIEDKNGRLSPMDRSQLSAYLRGKMAEQGSYRIIPSSTLKSRLKDQKKLSYRDCYAQSCQIAIGRELAAQKSLATQLLEVGGQCVLLSTLYDLRTAASERSASVRTTCRQDELPAAIDKVMARLRTASPPVKRDEPSPPPPDRSLAMRSRLVVTAEPQADESRSGLSTWKWITGAAAVAGISAGIALAVNASSRSRELEELIGAGNPSFAQPTEAFSDKMRQLERDHDSFKKASIATFVVGGAMAAASALFFALDSKPKRKPKRATVGPVLGAGTLGISGQVRF